MKVLLLGATGHLGGHLADRLSNTFSIAIAGRVDVTNERNIARIVDDASPTVVVNAIGAPPTAELATLKTVNAEFPRRLAAIAAARGTRVVHLSSDAVFSGRRGNYAEEDTVDPIDDYGRSKHAGELAPPHLTIRTSFFGRNRRGTGLVEWLVRQRGTVAGFEDYWFTGMSATIVADLIVDAIAAELEGLWHVGGDPVNKYELLVAVADHLGLDVKVTPVRNGAVDRTLSSARFFAAIGRRPPTLLDSLETLHACSPV